MVLSDWIAIISITIAFVALIYSIFTNTKKYELTYQYYNDILQWHNDVVETLIFLRTSSFNDTNRKNSLSKLSMLIEQGRFYFPNVNKKDGFGKNKPQAYQGYRNVILDFLIYSYKLFLRNDYEKYSEHAIELQRLFTSYVFQYLNPKHRRKQVKGKTYIKNDDELTIDDFLKKSPKYIYKLYSIKIDSDVQ